MLTFDNLYQFFKILQIFHQIICNITNLDKFLLFYEIWTKFLQRWQIWLNLQNLAEAELNLPDFENSNFFSNNISKFETNFTQFKIF